MIFKPFKVDFYSNLWRSQKRKNLFIQRFNLYIEKKSYYGFFSLVLLQVLMVKAFKFAIYLFAFCLN